MIVDLMRNDLGRVCRYGSIAAPALFRPEEHPGVWHLVSDVTGELRAGVLHRYEAGGETGQLGHADRLVEHQCGRQPRQRTRALAAGGQLFLIGLARDAR